jgi:hypothetical protein
VTAIAAIDSLHLIFALIRASPFIYILVVQIALSAIYTKSARYLHMFCGARGFGFLFQPISDGLDATAGRALNGCL